MLHSEIPVQVYYNLELVPWEHAISCQPLPKDQNRVYQRDQD